MRRLPPLNPLRVFEAAARTGSFNEAAEQLHVTASAVSHQVKALEEYLGVELFRRGARRIELTEVGRGYLPLVRDGLEQIGIATERVLQRSNRSVLTVSTAPAFAVGWLVPRLTDFQRDCPDIEVRLDASVEVIDFDRSDVDVCVRYTAQTRFDDLEVHPLFREELVPVCSPGFAAENELRKPEDLRRVRLLHVYARMGQWRSWLSAAGVADVDPEAGQKFAHDAISVEAAAAGMGVAIANRPLVQQQLEQGRLVAPFELSHCSEYGYYLLYPGALAEVPKVVAFRDWLLDMVDGAREPGQQPDSVPAG